MKKLADRLSANGKVLCAAGTNMVTLNMSAQAWLGAELPSI